MVSDEKLNALNAAVAEYGQAKFDEGAASVQAAPSQPAPAPSEGGSTPAPVEQGPTEKTYTESEVAARVQNALDAYIAQDKTTLTPDDAQAMVDSATTGLKAEVADLQLKLSQKDADALEEAIANQLQALADQLRARTEPAPVETAPVETQPSEDAPVEAAPTETAPTEGAPAEDAPVEAAPVEPAAETDEEKAERIARG